MGCYYNIETKQIKLRKDTPPEVIALLNEMINGQKEAATTPDHDFFKLERWDRVFSHMAWYDKGPEFYQLPTGQWLLYLNADINYGYKEIEQFAKWITPYVTGHKPKEFIGQYRCEDHVGPRGNLYIIRAA